MPTATGLRQLAAGTESFARIYLSAVFSLAFFFSLVFSTAQEACASPGRRASQAAALATAARLVNSPTDNFIASTEYANSWQSKRMPLKVFLHPCTDVSGYDPRYAEAFREACESWADATNKQIRFVFVESVSECDVELRWTADKSSWPGERDPKELGICRVTMSREGMDHAAIYLLTYQHNLHIGPRLMKAACLHELGHGFGLGHSGRSSDIMAPVVSQAWRVSLNGIASLEIPSATEIVLSNRDITTMKVVYSAKQNLDAFFNKNLGTPELCVALTNEAARLIGSGDSGQAIIILNEVLRLDSNFLVASQNLMVSYFNAGVELYNKQLYSEALPVLEKSIKLSRKYGSQREMAAISAVRNNCLQASGQNSTYGQAGSSYAVRQK